MVNFYIEPLLRVIQYDGLSLGISKSGDLTYYYYSVRGPKRGRMNVHHHYLNNKFIYLYSKNSIFLYIMSRARDL
jgi:hypothetical protein